MPTTSPLQRLLGEIHGRSMWQVVGLYLGGAWGVLEVTDQFVDRLILPDGVYRTALVLLAIGLPIVVATAYFEGGRQPAGGADGEKKPRPGRAPSSHAEEPAPPRRGGFRSLFTWRRALLGGLAAFALLGIGATGFYASRALGVGFAAPLIARGVLEERELVLLADFTDRAQDSLVARAVTEALRVDLAQSGAVRVADPGTVRQALERMQRDPDLPLTHDLARQVAAREGIKAYLVGAVDRLGTAYAVTARLVATESGLDLVAVRRSAGSSADLIDAVDALSRELRTRIGESLPSVNATPPLPQVTTASLEALEAFATGIDASRRGDRTTSIRWLEQAVRIDSTFASAYRALAIQHANIGNVEASDRYSTLARLHASRLPVRERFLTAAAYHHARQQRDSAVHYYQLILDADPADAVAANNLGDQYEWMGRYEEAMELYRRSADLDPSRGVTRVNLASAGRTLGQLALADSAAAAMAPAGDAFELYLPQLGANAVYGDRDAALDSLIRISSTHRDPLMRLLTLNWRAVLDVKRGRMGAGLARLDSAAAVARSEDSAGWEGMLLEGLVTAAVAGGDPAAALPFLAEWEATARTAPASFAGEILGTLAVIHARAGRAAAAAGYVRRADSLAAAAELPAHSAVLNARAVLALDGGNAEEALRLVEEAVTAGFGMVRHDYRLTRAQALEAAGHAAAAAAEYAALTSSEGVFWFDYTRYPALLPMAHERAGAAYLAAGDTASALRHLGAFVELWEDADAALQPRVRAARERIEAIMRPRG